MKFNRFPLPPRLPVLLFLAALAVDVSAQEEKEETLEERVDEELSALRRRGATLLEKEIAMETLLELEHLGPYRLAQHLERTVRSTRRSIESQRKRHVRDFERKGPRMIQERLTREVQLEIETLRETIRANARDGSLTKEAIQQRSDPAWKRLAEILTITPQQVWEADEDLYEDFSELADLFEEEAILHRYHGEALERLRALGDSGARWLARLDPIEAPSETTQDFVAFLTTLAEAMTPMSDRARRTLEENAEKRSELDPEEFLGIRFLNRMRILFGMHPYAIDVKLCNASRGHSRDMKEHGFFSHTSPIPGKETPGKRAALEGTSGGAENIARGATTGQGSILQWWYSPGHHKNMLGSGSRIGLGRVETFWTQMFG